MPELDYYKPFTGADGVERKPIVERVEACRPMRENGTKLYSRALSVEDGWPQWYGWSIGPSPGLWTFVPFDEAASLTRQAVEDWARGVDRTHREASLVFGMAGVPDVLYAPDHASCNAAAHALADLLEVDDA